MGKYRFRESLCNDMAAAPISTLSENLRFRWLTRIILTKTFFLAKIAMDFAIFQLNSALCYDYTLKVFSKGL